MISYSKEKLQDTFSGIGIAFLTIPELLLYAYLAGVDPIIGVSSFLVVGLVTTFMGGRSGMLSGPEKVSAVLVASVIANFGTGYLPVVTLLVGVLIYLVGLYRLGKFIRLISKPVLLGFINGVTIGIIFNQLLLLQFSEGDDSYISLESFLSFGIPLIAFFMLAHVAFTHRKLNYVVGFAWAVGIALSYIFRPEPLLGTFVENAEMSNLSLVIPFKYINDFNINFTSVISVLPKIVLIAFVCVINSLVSLSFLDEVSEDKQRGDANQECKALGVGNMVSGLFGYLPGTCMFAQSVLNSRIGKDLRFLNLVILGTTFIVVLLIPNVVLKSPLFISVGILIYIALSTFSWSSFRYIKKVPANESFVLISVTCFTIVSNVAYAIVFGVIVSSMMFAWENAKKIRVRKRMDADGIKHFEIYGPLFFGSSETFVDKFTPENDPDEIELNFHESRIWDQTGIQALYQVCERYIHAGKKVRLSYLSYDSRRLLNKTKIASDIKIVTNENDPTYKVVTELTD